METSSDKVMPESYMTMDLAENCRQVDVSMQKNISFDGKPVTPTSLNGGVGEIFSLRDQLKQAKEKASYVQREVSWERRRNINKNIDVWMSWTVILILCTLKSTQYNIFGFQA